MLVLQHPPIVTDPETIAGFDAAFGQFVPHNLALGLRFMGFGEGVALMRLPYAEHLVGNPETGVLHGGPITGMLDAACGAAVLLKSKNPVPIATLDLRIDYLRPGTPRLDVLGRAYCYKLGKNVAFVHAVAFHEEEGDGEPIAAAAGAFMIATRGGPPTRPEGGA